MQHAEALARNPEGGCYYKPHPVLIHSGQYWRCKHGRNAFWSAWCPNCMVRHPLLAFRWHIGWRIARLRAALRR